MASIFVFEIRKLSFFQESQRFLYVYLHSLVFSKLRLALFPGIHLNIFSVST